MRASIGGGRSSGLRRLVVAGFVEDSLVELIFVPVGHLHLGEKRSTAVDDKMGRCTTMSGGVPATLAAFGRAREREREQRTPGRHFNLIRRRESYKMEFETKTDDVLSETTRSYTRSTTKRPSHKNIPSQKYHPRSGHTRPRRRYKKLARPTPLTTTRHHTLRPSNVLALRLAAALDAESTASNATNTNPTPGFSSSLVVLGRGMWTDLTDPNFSHSSCSRPKTME